MTIFYLPSTGAPSLTPAYDGEWEQTAAADRREMVTTRISSAMTDKADAETNADPGFDVLLRQYISAQQWEAYSFSGTDTWKLQIRGMEDSPSANFHLQIIAKVITSAGAVRGTLISRIAKSAEFNNGALENSGMSGSCATVAMQDGDHVMLEIGFRSTNTKTTSYTGTLNFGDDSGTDLPEDDVETAAYNPWFELSPTLVAYSAIKALAGVVGSVSNVPDRNVKITKGVVGVAVASTSSVPNTTLYRTRRLIGVSVDSTSVVADAPLKRIKPLAGTVISALSAVADTVLRVLRGFISVPAQGISTSAAVLMLTASLVGSAGGISSVPDENLKVTKKLVSVSIDSTSDLTGDLTVPTGGVVHSLAGQVDAASDVADAPLKRIRSLKGSTDGFTEGVEWVAGAPVNFVTVFEWVVGAPYANLLPQRPESNFAGDLTVTAAPDTLEGQVDAVSDVANANLEVVKSLAGQVDAVSDVADADVTLFRGLTGVSVDAVSDLTGDLTVTFTGGVVQALQGQVDVTSDITGDLTISGAVVLRGQVDAVSDVADANLEVVKSLSGQVDAVSDVADANLEVVKSLVGVSVDSISDVIGGLQLDRGIAGQVDVISDVADANFEVVKSLSGQIDSTSDVTGDLTISGAVVLQGQVDAVSAVADVNLEVVKSLVGVSVDAVSDVADVNLEVVKSLSGQVDAVSDVVDADVTLFRGLIGVSVDAVSGVLGDLKPDRGIAGQVDAISDVPVAPLEVTRKLTGVSVDAVSDVTGTLAVLGSVDLAGQIDVISSVTGARPVGVVSLGGVVASSSGTTALLRVTKVIVGVSVDAVSDVTGSLGVSEAQFIQGQIDAVSDVTGAVKPIRSLAGTVDAVSGSSGAIRPQRKLGGLCEPVSSVNGLVRPQRGLQSSVAGVSSLTGGIKVLFRLQGTVAGVSLVTGNLIDKGLYKLQGVVSAVSTVVGSLTVETFLVILFEVSVCEVIELETSVAEEVNLDSRID